MAANKKKSKPAKKGSARKIEPKKKATAKLVQKKKPLAKSAAAGGKAASRAAAPLKIGAKLTPPLPRCKRLPAEREIERKSGSRASKYGKDCA
ncbi:MAG: hypothetical protein U1F34_03540 [Gammaproteobacteria bacterium]